MRPPPEPFIHPIPSLTAPSCRKVSLQKQLGSPRRGQRVPTNAIVGVPPVKLASLLPAESLVQAGVPPFPHLQSSIPRCVYGHARSRGDRHCRCHGGGRGDDADRGAVGRRSGGDGCTLVAVPGHRNSANNNKPPPAAAPTSSRASPRRGGGRDASTTSPPTPRHHGRRRGSRGTAAPADATSCRRCLLSSPIPRHIDFFTDQRFFCIWRPSRARALSCRCRLPARPSLVPADATPAPARVAADATPAVRAYRGRAHRACLLGSLLGTLFSLPPSLTRSRRCCRVRLWSRRLAQLRPRGGRRVTTGRWQPLQRNRRAWPPRW